MKVSILILILYIDLTFCLGVYLSNYITKDNCSDSACLKTIIYNNGSIEKYCIDDNKNKNQIITSIQYNESLIIYNCIEEGEGSLNDCKYDYIKNELDFSKNCFNLDTKFEDNICCLIRIKHEGRVLTSGCIELNKYEIERFRWGISSIQFENDSNNNSSPVAIIECNDKISKINIIKIIFLLIMVINW